MAHDAAVSPSDRLEELERTLDSLREDSEVAHVLLGLSAALAEVRSVDDTLDLTSRMVPDLLGADRGFSVTYDHKSGQFELRAHFGFSPEAAAQLRAAASSEGGLRLLKAAMGDRVPLLIEDPVGEGYITPEEAAAREIGSYIGIPLIRWGEDFGGIGLIFRERQTFGGKDHALARGIGRQVGVALSNARQFSLLRTLGEIGREIGSRLRLAEVIEAISTGATELLGADYATVYLLDQSSSRLIAAGLNGHEGPLPDRLTRLDLTDGQWSGLRNQTIFIANLNEADGTADDSPTAAIAAPIRSIDGATVAGAIVA
ncbi:MAG: GAF domain-containing protein, partial [Actinomycetota bacterium]|nr:GAF domain-containing protein [Actinomycetota bacterium]